MSRWRFPAATGITPPKAAKPAVPVPAFADWKRQLGEAGEWAILTAHGYSPRGVGWRGVDGTWYAQVEALRHVHRALRG